MAHPSPVVLHRGLMIMLAMSISTKTGHPPSYSHLRHRFRQQPGAMNMFGAHQDNNSVSDTTEPSINLRNP
jgi:hypothetical protein